MRWFYLLLLVLMVTPVAVFAAVNPDPVAVRYPGGAVALTAPQLVGAAYLLGMASGWTVVGLLRRSLWKATTGPRLPGAASSRSISSPPSG